MSERLREFVGWYVYRLGKLIVRFGDWIGGWGDVGQSVYRAGFNHGKKWEREREWRQAQKRRAS